MRFSFTADDCLRLCRMEQFLYLRLDFLQIGVNSRNKSSLLVNQHAGGNGAAAETIEDGLVFVGQERVRDVMLVAERFQFHGRVGEIRVSVAFGNG